MIPRLLRPLLWSICVLGLLVIPAAADTYSWGDMPGSEEGEVDFLNISESSDTDPLPLFGQPTRMDNRLYFMPTSFVSVAQNGSSDETSGMMSMTIVADEGYFLERVTVMEMGDYLLTGVGTQATYAGVAATLTVEPGAHVAQMAVDPPSPYYLPASGSYEGYAEINLAGLHLTQIDLTFENVLTTGSEAGTAASIQKNIDVLPIIDVAVIPEPACLSLLALGGLALIRRRRA